VALVATFSGVNAKLRRADTHFKAIEHEVTQFLSSNPYRFIGEYDSSKGQLVAKARQVVHPDTDFWATLIGDCVHNLRSALDHLAHQLLAIQGGTPKIGRGGTAFPIYDTSVGPKGGPRTVHITGDPGSVSGPILTFVEGVQPYNRVNDPNGHPLWILSELDNMDKHRSLTTAAGALSGFSIGIGNMGDINLYFDFVGFTGPFDETTELARWKATVTGPNPHVDMYPSGPIDVLFDATAGLAAGRPVLSTLTELRDYVTNIIEILTIKALMSTVTEFPDAAVTEFPRPA
jgi:hypothetical protein